MSSQASHERTELVHWSHLREAAPSGRIGSISVLELDGSNDRDLLSAVDFQASCSSRHLSPHLTFMVRTAERKFCPNGFVGSVA